MKALLNKLSSMLEENTSVNSWSSTRFAFLFSVLISNILIFGTVVYETILTGKVPDVPDGALFLYMAANGISFAGKVTQKINELKNSKTETPEDKEPEDQKQILNG